MTAAPKDRPAEIASADAPPEASFEEDEAEAGFELDIGEDDARPNPFARGAAAIKEFCRRAPVGPGVYRMIAGDGEVLYVG